VFTVRNIAKYFKIDSLIDFLINYPPEVNSDLIIDSRQSKVEIIARMTEDRFPIMQQDKKLRDNPQNFENLRTEYNYRREFSDSFLKKLEIIANLN